MSLTKVSYSLINGAQVNVLDYGAVGDGTTNDTAAIQAALNSLTAGGTVWFPQGTYLVSTLTIPNTGARGISLVGAGSWTWSGITPTGPTKIKANGASPIFTVPAPSSGTTFSNFIFDGDTTSTTAINGLASRITVTNCFASKFTAAGVTMTEGLCQILFCVLTGNTGDGLRMASDGRVQGCYLSANGGAGLVSYGTGLGGTLVSNNEMAFNKSHGINIYATSSLGNIFISGNYIEDNGIGATVGTFVSQIYCDGTASKFLSNIKIIHNYVSTVHVDDGVIVDGAHFVNCSQVVYANAVHLCGAGSNTAERYSVYFDNVDQFCVSDISIRANYDSALRVENDCNTYTINNISVLNSAFKPSGIYAVVLDSSNASVASNIIVADYSGVSPGNGINSTIPISNCYYYGPGINTISTGFLYTPTFGNVGTNINFTNTKYIPQATAPSTPAAGQVYYDSGTNKLYCWNGSSWNALF